MKYLCLVYLDETKLDAVPDRDCMAFGDTLRKSGRYLAAEALHLGGGDEATVRGVALGPKPSAAVPASQRVEADAERTRCLARAVERALLRHGRDSCMVAVTCISIA